MLNRVKGLFGQCGVDPAYLKELLNKIGIGYFETEVCFKKQLGSNSMFYLLQNEDICMCHVDLGRLKRTKRVLLQL